MGELEEQVSSDRAREKGVPEKRKPFVGVLIHESVAMYVFQLALPTTMTFTAHVFFTIDSSRSDGFMVEYPSSDSLGSNAWKGRSIRSHGCTLSFRID